MRSTHTEETITGTVNDPIAGVKSLSAEIDGQSSDGSVGAGGIFSYTTSLPLNGSADGAHTLQFVAVDGAGNTTNSAPSDFHARHPAAGRHRVVAVKRALETGNFDIAGQANVEQGAGPVSLTAALDGGAAQPVKVLADGSFAFATTLKTDGSNDGPNTYSLVATEQAGNTSAPLVFPITLETQGPSLTIAPPPALTATNLTISGHTADALGHHAGDGLARRRGGHPPDRRWRGQFLLRNPLEARRLGRSPAHGPVHGRQRRRQNDERYGLVHPRDPRPRALDPRAPRTIPSRPPT